MQSHQATPMTERETAAVFAALDFIDWFPREYMERVYAAMDARGAAPHSGAPTQPRPELTDADIEFAAVLYVLQLLRGRNYVRPSRRLREDDWTFIAETIH